MHERTNGPEDIADIHRKMDEEGLENQQVSQQNSKSSFGELSISGSDDASEKEADQLASRMVNGGKGVGSMLSGFTSMLNAKHEGDAINPPPGFAAKLDAAQGSGAALEGSTLGEMESGLGTSLGDVKIHTGSGADELNRNINAKAFTHGSDIYFRNGAFNPSSREGKELLAHELVHTQQERRNGISLKRIHRKFEKDPEIFSFYKTRDGDTLAKIALDYDCDWKQILVQNASSLGFSDVKTVEDVKDINQYTLLKVGTSIQIPLAAYGEGGKFKVSKSRSAMDKKVGPEDTSDIVDSIKLWIINEFTSGMIQGCDNFSDMAIVKKMMEETEEKDFISVLLKILEGVSFVAGLFELTAIVDAVQYINDANTGYEFIKNAAQNTKKAKARKRVEKKAKEQLLSNFVTGLKQQANNIGKHMQHNADEFVTDTLEKNPGITKENIKLLYLQKYYNPEFWDLSGENVTINVNDVARATAGRAYYEYAIRNKATTAFKQLFKPRRMGLEFGKNPNSPEEINAVAGSLKDRVRFDMTELNSMEKTGRAVRGDYKSRQLPTFDNYYNYLSRALQGKNTSPELEKLLKESIAEIKLTYDYQVKEREYLAAYIDGKNKTKQEPWSTTIPKTLEIPDDEMDMDDLRKQMPSTEQGDASRFGMLSEPYTVQAYKDGGLEEGNTIVDLIMNLQELNKNSSAEVRDVSTDIMEELEGYTGAEILPQGKIEPNQD